MIKKAQAKTGQRSARPEDIVMGTKIRVRRVEVGMSQATLGQKLGVSFQQVQKYEKGVNRVSASRLQKIAEVLEIGVNHFMQASSKQESELANMITDSASQRLLRAFHKIEDHPTRYKVVGLLEAITSTAA